MNATNLAWVAKWLYIGVSLVAIALVIIIGALCAIGAAADRRPAQALKRHLRVQRIAAVVDEEDR